MSNTTQPALNVSAQSRFAAAALALTLTLLMFVGVNQLAISDAPAALVAQLGSARG